MEIEDLISFARTFYDNPKIIILEKLLQINGFVIADLKINFDNKGNIKNNYFAKGYVKDTKLTIQEEINIQP